VRLLHALGERAHPSTTRISCRGPGWSPSWRWRSGPGWRPWSRSRSRPGGPCGVNAQMKVPCLVAGIIGGADSIDDMDLLRHGAMDVLFGGIRAPSTLGSHLRCYTWGTSASWRR
jgi:hypothetical protein